jgi:hypothetical protein
MVETSTAPKTRLRTCPKCKKEFETQNLILFGAEVFRDRDVLCNPCADAIDAQQAQERVHSKQTELEQRWEQICPVGFRDTDPAKLPCLHGMNEIISWPYGPKGILAHGATGMGKTRCLLLRLRTLHFKEHRSIKAIGAANFGLKCAQFFWEDQSKAAGFIDGLIRVDVLLLDDLDKAKFTERTETELFNVINERTANGKPILASLNVTGEELAAMLSEHRGWPIVRRLRDFCRPVDFDQP